MPHLRSFVATVTALGALGTAWPAAALDFAAVVSPPRFELRAQPGERVRQVVEITNVAPQPSRYSLRTADWTLAVDGSVAFSEDLAPGSCRSWVAIERREIEVPGGGRYRYRFEVQPPPDATPGECRFALMIEGDPQTVETESGLPVPVSGRIGVIVYVVVGSASPDLQVVETSVADTMGGMLPVLTVRNTGNAHARLDGFLSGADARGRKLEFSPSTLPILPGETRTIPLSASDGKVAVNDLAYPVEVAGVIEWGDGRRIEIDQPFAR
jgi:P pilus assembly chaperone PapD